MKTTPKIRKRFAENLRMHRHEDGLSQANAAKGMGVSLRQYCAWEREEQSASLDNLEKVAKFYKVHERELLK